VNKWISDLRQLGSANPTVATIVNVLPMMARMSSRMGTGSRLWLSLCSSSQGRYTCPSVSLRIDLIAVEPKIESSA
jgi:hypothetical protein